ncbi:MAG TPA: class I SAM-dependent methyltransferase [Phycisphaerae bacterium]|nr:class I SAM-dependent methyltransferase [Phycisphaerae bacterium]HRW55069.1 class I SAM-dependent methyltransferase [Phycisphaerae bacterium]
MNRERRLDGPNGYAREIGVAPLDSLIRIARAGCHAKWLDLCCGTGRALIEAAQRVEAIGLADRIQIIGVDLAGCFQSVDGAGANLTLHEGGVEDWPFGDAYDLVTCIHGLHYIGDKLNVIRRAVASLSSDGVFRANLDLSNIRHADRRPMGRVVTRWLRAADVAYDTRRRLVQCAGPKAPPASFIYLGADDGAGPNYTGQGAVDSYYRSAD